MRCMSTVTRTGCKPPLHPLRQANVAVLDGRDGEYCEPVSQHDGGGMPSKITASQIDRRSQEDARSDAGAPKSSRRHPDPSGAARESATKTAPRACSDARDNAEGRAAGSPPQGSAHRIGDRPGGQRRPRAQPRAAAGRNAAGAKKKGGKNQIEDPESRDCRTAAAARETPAAVAAGRIPRAPRSASYRRSRQGPGAPPCVPFLNAEPRTHFKHPPMAENTRWNPLR